MTLRSGKVNSALVRTLAFLTALVLLLGASAAAEAAAPTPLDPSRAVALTVELSYRGTPIPGASFSLYRVGDIGADASLTLDAPFSARFDVSDPQSRSDWDALARDMALYCKANRVAALETGRTGADGLVRFGGPAPLTSGLYLVVGADVDYRNVRYTSLPFLITLPNWNAETGDWDYAVHAIPKLDRAPTPTPTPRPTSTPRPSPRPSNPRLPQTGLLWWPVPALLLLGAALIVGGLLRRRGSGYEEE